MIKLSENIRVNNSGKYSVQNFGELISQKDVTIIKFSSY